MGRIRTIKPEFFTDEKLGECSTSARLLFVGTFCVADDQGNLERSSQQLKNQIFPQDSFSVEPLIQELLAQELLVEYEEDGKRFLHIKNFLRHQKIDRPSKPRLPLYEDSKRIREDSTSARRVLDAEGKGKEGKGKEGTPPTPPEGGAPLSGDTPPTTKPTPVTSTNTPETGLARRRYRNEASKILVYLNQTTGRGFHEVDANLEPIEGRLKEGATVVQCKSVIVAQWQAWRSDEKMHEYLRPQTLFRKSNFWSYLGKITPAKPVDQKPLALSSPSGIESSGSDDKTGTEG